MRLDRQLLTLKDMVALYEEQVVLDMGGWYTDGKRLEILRRLHTAVVAQRLARFTYRNLRGIQIERTVEPKNTIDLVLMFPLSYRLKAEEFFPADTLVQKDGHLIAHDASRRRVGRRHDPRLR
jgi:hypothetical protein